VVNIAGLEPDQATDLMPTVIAPDEIQAQLIPPSVVVEAEQ
jgi:hypothetical protein